MPTAKRSDLLANLLTKMNSKKSLIFIVSSLFVLFFLVPTLILAQGAQGNQSGKALCNRLGNLYEKAVERITDKDGRITQKRDEMKQKLDEHWQIRGSKLTEKREKWNENRADHFIKLEEKAQTDVQKQAIITFRQAMEAAIAARRTAVDKAITDFRQGVENIKATRQSAIDAAKSVFRNSVKLAYEKAQSDCPGSIDAATLRLNLKNSLQAAKAKYQSDLQAAEKLKTNMEELTLTRKASIEKANQDFRTVVEKARSDFKAVMGQETE